MPGPLGSRSGAWSAVQLAAVAGTRPDAVAHLGLRTASPLAEHALALAATAGDADGDDLAVTDDLEGRLTRTVDDPAAAAALALLWSGCGDARQPLGARTYAWLARCGALPPVARHHQGAAQALFLTGRTSELRELWPSLDRLPRAVRHDLTVDLLHPSLAPDTPGQHQRWAEALGSRFVEHGLSAPTVAQESPYPHLFDRLRPAVEAGTAGGPLVTVIVPCWRPDEGLLTSVASITAQTYADLEVVVVDDASGPGYEELFHQVTGGDPRVRLLRLERNGGSYLARRAALETARGELVTTQDADDWSHPERVERQVEALLAHPDSPASRSLAVRARDDLTHQWFGYRAVRDNASSLLVRRAAFAAAGTFWPIRKSADSEFAERLAHVLGPIVDTGTPLAITRLRGGSLSRGDFSYQWAHPDRVAFRGTYRAWHRTLPAAGQVDTREDHATGRHEGLGAGTPFQDTDLPEAPAPFARGLPLTPTSPALLDLCIVGDLSSPPEDGRNDSLVRALTDLPGLQVGLWHLERPLALDLARPEMHPAWYDRVLTDPRLHLVTRTRDCEVGTVLVTDPTVLLTAVAQPTGVRAGQVEVALDPSLAVPGEASLPADLLAVADACRTWWGLAPTWVLHPAVDEGAASAVREDLPGLGITAGFLMRARAGAATPRSGAGRSPEARVAPADQEVNP